MTKEVHTYRGISFTVPKIQKDVEYGEKIYHPTLLRIRNLLDMVDALRSAPPPAFDMSSYAFIPDYRHITGIPAYVHENVEWVGNVQKPAVVTRLKGEENICGTSCCALGTAAWHGIGKMTRSMTWEQYSEKNYGLNFEGELWDFVFSGNWYEIDNTPEGAAARILKLVIDGPEVILNKTGLVFERGGMRGRSWENLLENTYQENDIETIKCFYGDYLVKEVN
jgi:hypothetical protein